jgi:hypothetical protein
MTGSSDGRSASPTLGAGVDGLVRMHEDAVLSMSPASVRALPRGV